MVGSVTQKRVLLLLSIKAWSGNGFKCACGRVSGVVMEEGEKTIVVLEVLAAVLMVLGAIVQALTSDFLGGCIALALIFGDSSSSLSLRPCWPREAT